MERRLFNLLAEVSLKMGAATVAGQVMSRRLNKGQCRACGYDLRASKGRCPECGTALPAVRAS